MRRVLPSLTLHSRVILLLPVAQFPAISLLPNYINALSITKINWLSLFSEMISTRNLKVSDGAINM
jgi:hypothetical protein